MEIDWPMVFARLLLALLGACVGSLVVVIPIALIAGGNVDFTGWLAGIWYAGMAIGTWIGWRTPYWAEW